MESERSKVPQDQNVVTYVESRSQRPRQEREVIDPKLLSLEQLQAFETQYLSSLKSVFDLRSEIGEYLGSAMPDKPCDTNCSTLACHGTLEYRKDCSIEFLTFGRGQPVIAIDGFLVHFNYSLLYLKDLPDDVLDHFQFILINPQGVGLSDYRDRSKSHHFIHDLVGSLRAGVDYRILAFSGAAKHAFDFLAIGEDDRCAGIYLASPPPLEHLLDIPRQAREFAMSRNKKEEGSALSISSQKTENMFEAITSEMKLYGVEFQNEDEKLLQLAFRNFNLNFRTCLDVYEKHADYEQFCERAKNLHILHCTNDPKFDYKGAVDSYRELFGPQGITEHYIDSGHFPDWTHRDQFLGIIETFLES